MSVGNGSVTGDCSLVSPHVDASAILSPSVLLASFSAERRCEKWVWDDSQVSLPGSNHQGTLSSGLSLPVTKDHGSFQEPETFIDNWHFLHYYFVLLLFLL